MFWWYWGNSAHKDVTPLWLCLPILPSHIWRLKNCFVIESAHSLSLSPSLPLSFPPPTLSSSHSLFSGDQMLRRAQQERHAGGGERYFNIHWRIYSSNIKLEKSQKYGNVCLPPEMSPLFHRVNFSVDFFFLSFF